MTLQEYFSGRIYKQPEFGTVGAQTEWMSFCALVLRGPRFLIVDADFVPEEQEGVSVEARSGLYILEAKALDYDGDARVSRLRCFLGGSSPRIGNTLGETWTDTAKTGICDLDIFKQYWGDDIEYLDKFIRPATQTNAFYGIAVVDDSVEAVMPFVESGFGDGRFPVYELVDGERRVGFEIEFIAAEDTYPY